MPSHITTTFASFAREENPNDRPTTPIVPLDRPLDRRLPSDPTLTEGKVPMGPLAYITLVTEAISALSALLKVLNDNGMGPDDIRSDLHALVDASMDRNTADNPGKVIRFALDRFNHVHAASQGDAK